VLTPVSISSEGLELIVGPCIGQDEPDRRFAAVLICYLDDSGTGDEPIITMSGYIAAYPRWLEFEQAAGKIFAAFGITELHGKEFNATKGQFKGWSRKKKEALAAHLYFQLRGISALGIDCGITRTAYHKARFEHGEAPNESGYGNCFRRIVDFIMRSDMMKYHVSQHKATLSFVVEAGNKNDADINRVFNQMKFNPNHVGVVDVLKSVSFADKGSAIALQMADFPAFHSRRYKSQCEKAKSYLPLTDLQKVIFHAIDTKTSLNHVYLTNEEIASGYKEHNTWRISDDP
jgi:hypothetical protein